MISDYPFYTFLSFKYVAAIERGGHFFFISIIIQFYKLTVLK